MSSWKVLLCWENPVRNVSFNVIRGFNVKSDNFSLLQASIVTIAEPSLPLLISSPQRLTAWWCQFICILFRVWLLHLRSMCGAQRAGGRTCHMAKSFGVFDCVYCNILYLRTCSCSLKVTFGMDQNVLLSRARGFALGCCV